MTADTTRIIGTCIEFLAAIIGLIVYKKAGLRFRLFALFLFYGFLTDVLTRSFNTHYNNFAWIVFLTYTFVESFFFLLFIRFAKILTGIWLKALQASIIIIPILFFPFHFDILTMQSFHNKYDGYFSFIYQIIGAGFATAALLKFVETKENATNHPDYFFLIGIFFYCFCSFSIDFFIGEEIAKKIWWIHDLANIVSYL